jgi:HJR/Mrr/RecB family endonuclease
MSLFNKSESPRYTLSTEPTEFGFKISLMTPRNQFLALTLETISSLNENQLEPSVALALTTAVQNADRFQLDAEATELSPDVFDAFTTDEINMPLLALLNGALHISNLCVATARSGNLDELANLTNDSLHQLNIPEYTPLKAKLQAHGGVENSKFALDLDIMDLNGERIILKRKVGHIYSDDGQRSFLISPYLHRLIERHVAHKKVRQTPEYIANPQYRFRELADLRKSALNAEIRIDPFVQSQKIVFLNTLPYVLGRGPDEQVLLNPALPEEHGSLDRTFQAIINSSEDNSRPTHLNIHDELTGTTRVVFSERAWEDVQRIKSLQSQGQAKLEEVMQDPLKFFGRKPRAAIARTFSERVSGFIIGKLTSNRSDSNSGNHWGDGYEGESTLLRATDGSTIPLAYAPTPPEYGAMKRACLDLSDATMAEELSFRIESGALLTPVPLQKNSRVFIQELNGEFSLNELRTCCSRIEYSNRVELLPEEEAKAREVVTLSEGNLDLVVEWGQQENGTSRFIPLQSLKSSLPQSVVESANDRVSLAIEDHSTRLGQAPTWHYQTCDLNRFASPPYFKSDFSLEDHQKKGIAWLTWIFEHAIDKEKYPHRGALLADDMGLGKTVQILAFVAAVRALPTNGKKPILIVAPVSLIQSSWLEDGFAKFFESQSVYGYADGSLGPISHFSECPIKVDRELLLSEALRVNDELKDSEKRLSDCEIDDTLRQQLVAIDQWAQGKIVVTSYETLRLNSLALGSINFSAVILDEAQKIKNVGVLQSNAAKSLKADMCVAMTGTPIENSLMDLWSIMDFVLPGHLGTDQQFREQFVNPVKRTTPNSPERAALRTQLERALSPVWFRRTKKEVFKDAKSLPPIRHYDESVDSSGNKFNEHEVQMSEQQFSIYETQVAYFQNAKPGHKLPVIRSMIEACTAPWLATDENLRWANHKKLFALSPKLETTVAILDSIRKRPDAEGRKVIIFANIIQLQMGLAFFIFEWNKATGGKPMEIEVYNGDATPKSRAEMLKRFKDGEGFQVLIISPKAGGAGLNIVEANNVIHYTREWNPALERQATDRVYRMGQKRQVHVYYPTTSLRDREMVSAEERLANILSAKRDIMDDFTVSASDHNLSENDLGGMNTGAGNTNSRIDANGVVNLDPYSFECLIACIYDKLGFDAKWCGKSGDGGADVVAFKSNAAVLIQVKHTKGKIFVGTPAIQQVRGAKTHYESKLRIPLKLVAATNFKFSERAVQRTREGEPVELLEFSHLKDLLQEYEITHVDIEKKKAEGRFKI